MEPRIAVLDASIGETPAERNLRRSIAADISVFKLSAGELPPPPAADRASFDGVVISGSQTSVYEDREWIHGVTEWVRQVHSHGRPMLGICWGHQLLAQALGGRVVDMQEYELGYRTVERLGDDPLMHGIPRTITAFETHADRVAELPAGSRTLARNDFGVQAFRLGSTYGVQFHPEYDRETAEWVIESKDLPDARKRQALGTVTDDAVESAEAATRVFDNFQALVASAQPSRSG
jgi:GMP synthase (glutamine-hydrolysing)